MECSCCKLRTPTNKPNVTLTVVNLPAYARNQYTLVDPQDALVGKHSHLSILVTEILICLCPLMAMASCAASKLLHNSMNRAYLSKVLDYYSFHARQGTKAQAQRYVEKDGNFMQAYPPLGDSLLEPYTMRHLQPGPHSDVSVTMTTTQEGRYKALVQRYYLQRSHPPSPEELS